MDQLSHGKLFSLQPAHFTSSDAGSRQMKNEDSAPHSASSSGMPSLYSHHITLILIIFLLPSSLSLSSQTVHSQTVTSCGLDCSCYPPPPPSYPNLIVCGAACCPPPSVCADTSTFPPTCMSSAQCALNSSASLSSCASALEMSRALADRYAGYLHDEDLSSPALLQQLETSMPELHSASNQCN
jgi:hypothetical protein